MAAPIIVTTTLALCSHEAALVREIFRWYVEEGLTIYAIAQRLTAQGIATAYSHAAWTPSAVRRILGNASYSGMA